MFVSKKETVLRRPYKHMKLIQPNIINCSDVINSLLTWHKVISVINILLLFLNLECSRFLFYLYRLLLYRSCSWLLLYIFLLCFRYGKLKKESSVYIESDLVSLYKDEIKYLKMNQKKTEQKITDCDSYWNIKLPFVVYSSLALVLGFQASAD